MTVYPNKNPNQMGREPGCSDQNKKCFGRLCKPFRNCAGLCGQDQNGLEIKGKKNKHTCHLIKAPGFVLAYAKAFLGNFNFSRHTCRICRLDCCLTIHFSCCKYSHDCKKKEAILFSSNLSKLFFLNLNTANSL